MTTAPLYILILIGLASLGIGIDAYRRHTERTPIIVLWCALSGLGMIVYSVVMLIK